VIGFDGSIGWLEIPARLREHARCFGRVFFAAKPAVRFARRTLESNS
jgi:hypothetical protein